MECSNGVTSDQSQTAECSNSAAKATEEDVVGSSDDAYDTRICTPLVSQAPT
jgi:hypothetical protein